MFTEAKNGRYFKAAVVSARKGRYTEASKLLQKALDGGECSKLLALDLQARIFAQQGFYLEAESCWRRAKELDRSNYDFNKCIARLHQTRTSPGFPYPTLAFIFLIVVSLTIFWQGESIRSNVQNRIAATDRSLADLRQGIMDFQKDLQTQAIQTASGISGLERALKEHEIHIADRLEDIPTTGKMTDNFNVATAELDRALKGLETRIADRLENFPTSETMMGYNKIVVDSIQAGIDRFEALTMPVVLKFVRQDDMLTAITAKLDSQGELRRDMMTRITELYAKLSHSVETEELLQEIHSNLTQVSNSMQDLKVHLAKAESLTDLQAQVGQVRQQLAAVTAFLEDLKRLQSPQDAPADERPVSAQPTKPARVDQPE
ncbi:MAG: hypothetical protein C4530_03885 [Desulfobacteraceae bacterium]|nr:MAG: hypothetical protein C4530_03885 [Desulfobacteraceae bacterium]